jgi:hypothetical protein
MTDYVVNYPISKYFHLFPFSIMQSRRRWKNQKTNPPMVITHIGQKKWVFLGFFMETQKPKKKRLQNQRKKIMQ